MTKIKDNHAEQLWETGWTYIRGIVDTAREPFLVLDKDLRVIAANEAFYRFFLESSKKTEKTLVYDLGNGQWAGPHLRRLLEDVLPQNTFFNDFEVDHEFPLIGRKIMLLNARRVYETSKKNPFAMPPLIILAMEDVIKQRSIEEKLANYTKDLEAKVMERTRELEVRIVELERLNKTMVHRELKMLELKHEIDALKVEVKKNGHKKS